MQHHPRCYHNDTFLSLSHPIPMWVVGCCQLSSNAFFCTKKIKFIRQVLTSIITLESLHLFSVYFSTSALNYTNMENVSSSFHVKKIQHFHEKSLIQMTKYLFLEVEAVEKGPQTSEWILSNISCALLSLSWNLDFVYFPKVHPLHTSCCSSTLLRRPVVICCIIFKAP